MMKISEAAATFQHSEIIDKWKTRASSNWEYFDIADDKDWISTFWNEGTKYRAMFDQLDIDQLVEIACGRGRHSHQVANSSTQMWLVDTSIDALSDAKIRFAGYPNVNICLSSDGLSLDGVPDGIATAVFSYDAMVHFELMTVACYVKETARVLKPGGRGLFHHSNFSDNPTGRIDENRGWRNFMTKDIMNHLLSRSGMKIIEQISFDRENIDGDAITLFEKMI